MVSTHEMAKRIGSTDLVLLIEPAAHVESNDFSFQRQLARSLQLHAGSIFYGGFK